MPATVVQEHDTPPADTSGTWMSVPDLLAADRSRLGGPTAELVHLKASANEPGHPYVRLTILGDLFFLPIADAVDLVDAVATALAGVAE